MWGENGLWFPFYFFSWLSIYPSFRTALLSGLTVTCICLWVVMPEGKAVFGCCCYHCVLPLLLSLNPSLNGVTDQIAKDQIILTPTNHSCFLDLHHKSTKKKRPWRKLCNIQILRAVYKWFCSFFTLRTIIESITNIKNIHVNCNVMILRMI